MTSASTFAEALEQHGMADAVARELESGGTRSLAAWFLGPKAENETLLHELVREAIAGHAQDRRGFFPDDPLWITGDIKCSPAYEESVAALRGHYANLIARLRGSVPFFSYRYQAHMLWDVTLPALAGYFAAMLYNQNNVAAEASPVTTCLEMAVGNDLCRMLGYGRTGEIRPWGHITCDGTVANIEAMWAARNLKYYPLALAAALEDEPALERAKDLLIRLPDAGEAMLRTLERWQLLNLRADDVLAVPGRLEREHGIEADDLAEALSGRTLQDLGYLGFARRYPAVAEADAVVLGPGTMHYSWPKGAALLGIGEDNLIHVPVDLDARIDLRELERRLEECLSARRPVLLVVVVLGSTEESAVDPLAGVIAMRKKLRRKGLDFAVHVDGAWGGYFASLLREPAKVEDTDALTTAELRHLREFTPDMSMSPYVTEQYEALPHADSITVDPHKAGYVPYPAGGLCYRNSAMRNLVSFTAPVVYHGGVDQTVGVYGIEGSKPGAAAAGTFLSHRVIRTDRSGYGKILGKSLFNSKRLYAALVTMACEDDPFIVKTLQRLPAERAGQSPDAVAAQLAFIRERIVPPDNDDLLADDRAMALFRELGSDQIIISYAFNFRMPAGTNRDVTALNKLNDAIFRRLSLSPDRDVVSSTPLFVTASDFDPKHGRALIDSFRTRLGVEGDPNLPIIFLISTTMDPWLTDTAAGNFVPTIIAALRQTVLEVIEELSPPAADTAALGGS